jgi:hypothetical protein
MFVRGAAIRLQTTLWPKAADPIPSHIREGTESKPVLMLEVKPNCLGV